MAFLEMRPATRLCSLSSKIGPKLLGFGAKIDDTGTPMFSIVKNTP
jgi:hypothetical protein